MAQTLLHIGNSLLECSHIRSVLLGSRGQQWTLAVVFHGAPRVMLLDFENEESAREMLVEIGKTVAKCNPYALCTDHFVIDCMALTHLVTVEEDNSETRTLDLAFRGSELPCHITCRDGEDAIIILNMIKNHITQNF